jgi:hypothetical protein
MLFKNWQEYKSNSCWFIIFVNRFLKKPYIFMINIKIDIVLSTR